MSPPAPVPTPPAKPWAWLTTPATIGLLGIVVGLIGGLLVANLNNQSAAERELTARRYDAAQALLGKTTAALAREREWAFRNQPSTSISGHVDQASFLAQLDEAIAAQTNVALLMPELEDEAIPLVGLVLSGYGDMYGGEYPSGSMEGEWDQRRRDFEVAAAVYARAVRAYFGIPEPSASPLLLPPAS